MSHYNWDKEEPKCDICRETATHMVEFETYEHKEYKAYFCKAHMPNFNPDAKLICWNVLSLYIPRNYQTASISMVRNPITREPARYKATPRITTEMRCAMKRFMHKNGFFEAAKVLTLGADENDRLEVLTLAAQMDREMEAST